MPQITHSETIETLRRHLAGLDDGAVLGHELIQKGAMDALVQLLRTGCTEANARRMLESLGQYAEAISAECAKRGLVRISDPRGH